MTRKTKQQLIDELIQSAKELEATRRALSDLMLALQSQTREIRELLSAVGEDTPVISAPADLSPILRKATERFSALAENERRYRLIIDQANDIIYQTDQQGRFTFFNSIAVELLGYSLEEILGSHYLALVHPDYRRKVEKFYGLQFVKGTPDSYLEIPLLTKSGEILWIGQNVQLVREGDAIVGFQAIARNITDRKHAQEALKKSEEKYRAILEHIEEGYYEVDLLGRFTMHNESLLRIMGYPEGNLKDVTYRQFLDPRTARRVFMTFLSVYRTGVPAKAFDWALIRKDGTRSFIEVSVSLVTDASDRPIGFRGIARDITERKKLEEELRKLSITDNLTGLFNQRHFFIRVAEECKRAQRMGYPLCLILFDLDNFKPYNDTYGHLAGDEVLRVIGNIIKDSIRQDTDTGFRYGGDEFAVILPSSTEGDARGVAERIRGSVLTRIHGIDISVGIASLSEVDSFTALVHLADAAMYGQKGKRKK